MGDTDHISTKGIVITVTDREIQRKHKHGNVVVREVVLIIKLPKLSAHTLCVMYWGLCLDAGCGSGRNYRFNPHCPRHMETILLDIEEPIPEVKKWVASSPGTHLVIASITHLPFRENCINKIVLNHVIEHVWEIEKVFTELYRVLKRCGEVHVAFPNFLSRNARADPDHVHVLNFVKVSRMARKVGFSVSLETCVGSLLPSPLRRVLNLIVNLLVDEVRMRLHKR